MSVLDTSAATLAAGWLTFAGGAWCGRRAILTLSHECVSREPAFCAAAPIVGLGAIALLIEILAMAEWTSRPVLVAIGCATMVLGVFETHRRWRTAHWRTGVPRTAFARTMWGCAVLASGARAVAALAPSTKIDELHYHMLVPLRIVQDGGLRFYSMPWEGAILPHMLFQVGYAPLHALGIPDAGNIVEWAVAATFLIFTYRFVQERSGDDRLASIAVASISVGIYAVVSYAASGAHAIGDASLAIAGVVLLEGLDRHERRERLLLVPVLALCAACTKLSVWPLSVAMSIVAGWRYAMFPRPSHTARRLWWLALGWAIALSPSLIWLWAQSGSPFGPILATMVPHSAYDPLTMQFLLARSRVGAASLWDFVVLSAIAYWPFLWVLMVYALLVRTLSGLARGTLGALLVGQALLIAAFMSPQLRFMGGIHYSAAIVGCAYAGPRFRRALESQWLRGLAGATIVLWTAGGLYYVTQFVPVDLGLTSRAKFEEQYVALHKDLANLDRLLPPAARILVPNERFPTVSFPRPTYLDESDVPAGTELYFLTTDEAAARNLQRFRLDSLIYVDTAAIVQTYRTPGHRPDRGRVWVWRLHAIARP